MNKTLFSRLGKLETRAPSASAVIVYARWDETNEEALAAALPDGPPPGLPVYIHTERMSVDEWLKYVKCGRENSDWDRARHPTDGFFPGMEAAIRIRVAQRPWTLQ
jgi:hypothetical protein